MLNAYYLAYYLVDYHIYICAYLKKTNMLHNPRKKLESSVKLRNKNILCIFPETTVQIMHAFILKIQLFDKRFCSKEVSKPKEASYRYLGSFLLQSANLRPFHENFSTDKAKKKKNSCFRK